MSMTLRLLFLMIHFQAGFNTYLKGKGSVKYYAILFLNFHSRGEESLSMS